MPLKDPEAHKAYLREYAKKNPAYERVKAWRKKNPEAVKEAHKRYADKHPEVLLEKKRRYRQKHKDAVLAKERIIAATYRANNIEKVAAAKKTYALNNKSKINALVAKRAASKKQKTPGWLTPDDYWMIEQAYELAALRTKIFGFDWHVDHVLPLQGKTVSGLHVPTNLQVIPWRENLSKGNRLIHG
jgi:hypothetical protein